MSMDAESHRVKRSSVQNPRPGRRIFELRYSAMA